MSMVSEHCYTRRMDLYSLAIETLLAKSNDRAVMLAHEIERGRSHDVSYRHLTDNERTVNKQFMLDQLRPAQPFEYEMWMDGALKAGAPARHRSKPMPQMWVPWTDLRVRPLYGANSLMIVIPKGIEQDYGSTGHSDLYITVKSRPHYLYRGFHDTEMHAPSYVNVYDQ